MNSAQLTISDGQCVAANVSAKLAGMKEIPAWNKELLLEVPAFLPLQPAICRLGADTFPSLRDCNALLAEHHPSISVHRGHPLRFVAQEYGKLPLEEQYEPRCYLRGEVLTRENNWHDLLNALVWLTFPKAKAAINARHYQALIGMDGVAMHSQRGAVRDTNTLFDESGVIIACADGSLSALLRDFQWKELFWQRRKQVRDSMGFYLFGHGLYEKALSPYIGMTGQGLLLPVEQAFFGWTLAQQLAHLDNLLAAYLSAPQHCRDTSELSPVPLLGIPGWTADNEDATYYDNTGYFRSGRHGRAKG